MHPTGANGKNITFAWPSNLYNTGRFVLYNRSTHQNRIDTSTVEFFHGDSSVYLDTILNAGDTVTIAPDFAVEFNKIVLTFRTSGDGSQNFREIEVYGTPTPPTITNVSIKGADTVFVGVRDTLRATVTGINAPQTVIWSSSDETVATVSTSGVVQGVSTGTVTITATSTVDDSKKATKNIIVRNNIALSAEVTTTVDSVFGRVPVVLLKIICGYDYRWRSKTPPRMRI